MVVRPYDFNRMSSINMFNLAMVKGAHSIPISYNLNLLRNPIKLGNRKIANSMSIHPLEGFDGNLDGSPGELSFNKYKRFAKSGVGIIWFEATSISKDGIGNTRQFYINKDNVSDYKRLVKAVDEEQKNFWGTIPFKVLQITHSGRLSKPNPMTIFINPYLDKYYPKNLKIVSDEYIEELEDKVVEGAYLAAEAGFDAVDLKLCHDFLFRELLAGFTREGKYGGSFENRTRFTFNIISKIQKQLRDSIGLCVRLNAYDNIPYPYGWGMKQKEGVMEADLTEPKKLIRFLEGKGIKLFNITSIMPRIAPRREGYKAYFEKGAEIFPYEGEEFLLDATRQLKEYAPNSLFIATGLSWYQQFAPFVGAGGIEQKWFDIAGFGRMALAYPEMIENILKGNPIDKDKCCITCDGCYSCMEKNVPVGCIAKNPFYKNMVRGDNK